MNPKTLYRTVALFGLFWGLVSVGWAKTYHLASTSIVPAASGDVDVNMDNNGNVKVDLKIDNLARPESLTPPATTYIVWFQQEDSRPESQGQLKVGKNLKAELKTTTPWRKFDVFVTAENDPLAKTPSDRVLLRSQVQE